ncbi:MAG: TlpA family protein disulfide reductase [Pseudomonadales bacterium]|nr:TlpA family protein disulfide reductase [Pseudomonadales bacterium]
MKYMIFFALTLTASYSTWSNASPLALEDEYQLFGQGMLNLKKIIGHKPIYMKFWATWCLECRDELPNLQQAYEKHGSHIAMFAVNLNINESDEQIRYFQRRSQLTIPILMDNNGSIAGNFQRYSYLKMAKSPVDSRNFHGSHKYHMNSII